MWDLCLGNFDNIALVYSVSFYYLNLQDEYFLKLMEIWHSCRPFISRKIIIKRRKFFPGPGLKDLNLRLLHCSGKSNEPN